MSSVNRRPSLLSGTRSLARAAVTLIALVGVGCVVPSLSLDGYPCPADKDCGTGYYCIQGMCRSEPDCANPEDCPCESYCTADGACRMLECKVDRDCRCGYRCSSGGCVHPSKYKETCKAHLECASGRCLLGQCGGPCGRDSDCPAGRSCRLRKCVELAKEGEVCGSSDDCEQRLLCVRGTDGKLRCRSECLPGAPLCSGGKRCKLVELPTGTPTGACVAPTGGLSESARCKTGANECEVDLLCHQVSGEARCRRLCRVAMGGCPATQVCTGFRADAPKLGVCLARDCSTTRPCPTGSFCSNGVCVSGCKVDSDCLSHLHCNSGSCTDKQCDYPGRVCVAGEVCSGHRCSPESPKPRTCRHDGDCETSEKCVKVGGDKSLRCRRTCDIGDSAACTRSEVCLPLSFGKGVCYPRAGGGTAGALCNEKDKRCEWSHLCANTGAGNICLKVCYSQGRPCPQGLSCSSSSGLGLYVCRNLSSKSLGQPCGPLDGRCTPIDKLVCLAIASFRGICRQRCIPGSGSSTCKSNERCAFISVTEGACVPKS